MRCILFCFFAFHCMLPYSCLSRRRCWVALAVSICQPPMLGERDRMPVHWPCPPAPPGPTPLQAPDAMRSTCAALMLLASALGSYLAAALVSIVQVGAAKAVAAV